MSERVRGCYDDALYKSTYTLLYFAENYGGSHTPRESTAMAVQHHRQIVFAVIVVVVCVFTAAVIAAVCWIHCRRGRFVLVPKVGTEYSAVKSTKRVVIMHSNVLYQPGGAGGGSKDSESTIPFFPVVKIETGVSRLASQSASFSEYEIPLDNDWEFPRHL